MKFNIYTELSYEVISPTTFIYNILATKSLTQEIIKESIFVSHDIDFEEFSLKKSKTRFVKLFAEKQGAFSIIYNAEVDVKFKVIGEEQLTKSIPIIELNHEVLPYLSPSRHCQSDKFYKFVSKEFGYLPTEFEKVKAINDWIFKNIDYVPGVTTSSTSAYDTFVQREGVCKDFAHLAIALCRSIDIPSRYFTGYAFQLEPSDIHACYEAYIGGEWIVFDATKLCALNGLVKIANAKDASEVAVASYFGNSYCTYMKVECKCLEEEFTPFVDNQIAGLAY